MDAADCVFIVDGYNVIRNHERYRQLASRDLEAARIRLTEDLVDFTHVTGARVFLVYDGSRRTGKIQKKELLGVEVWFSAGGESADQVIEKLAFELQRESQQEGCVRVVTSDYDVQKTVFQKGVLRLSPQEMIKTLKDSKEEALPGPAVKREAVLEDVLEEHVKMALRELFTPEE